MSEQELPTELNDARAEFLFDNPAVLRRWRSCRAQTHTEADLVEEACVAKQGNPVFCAADARGYDPYELVNPQPEGDESRVAALIASDWPRASRRLARWHLELASGARLSKPAGEIARQDCTRLLIDACTGDLGEVCTRLTDDHPTCDGELLPDGRCRQYHFARLPLLPAHAPGH